MNCLGCGAAMTSWTCACGGAWVAAERLVELAEDVRGTMVTLPWASRVGAARPCPTCSEAMRTVSLAGVALDRCFAHGIWFDADELQDVLRHVEAFPAAKPAPADTAIKPAAQAIHCSGCGAVIATKDVLYTEDARVVCASCYAQADVRVAARRAEESTSVSSSGGEGWAFLGALLDVVSDALD